MKVTLRTAAAKDSRFVWLLRNSADVRAVSGDTRPILWTTHVTWWDRTDRDAVDIIVADGKRCGYMRMCWTNDYEVEVSIAISERYRGRGIGAVALRRMSEPYAKRKALPRIIAKVAVDNDASRAMFRKAGFVERWITMEWRG